MIALIFDTETTGFRSNTFTPEIVQIAAILQDMNTLRVLGEINFIVIPVYPIPEKVSQIHGITDAVASKFGIHKSLAIEGFATLANKADILVAHNIAFDVDIINGAWPIVFPSLQGKQQYCTMIESTPILKLPKNGNAFHNNSGSVYKYPKLTEAYRFFYNHDFVGAHDAMADVRACRDVYIKLQGINAVRERVQQAPSKVAEQQAKLDIKTIDMSRHIHESNLIENIDDPAEDELSLRAWQWFIKHTILTSHTIQYLQRFITKNQQDLASNEKGHYRNYAQVNVTVGGRSCPEWSQVGELMKQWLVDYPTRDPIENHITFEHIHPFVDGNGRTGRMLLWYQQILNNEPPTLFYASERFEKYYKLF